MITWMIIAVALAAFGFGEFSLQEHLESASQRRHAED